MAEENRPKIRTQKDADKHVKEQNEWHGSHGYKWITQEIAEDYYGRMTVQSAQNADVTSLRYTLCCELKTIYGVTETEAVNILNGYHINDYVAKYKRIATMTPIQLQRERKAPKGEEEDENIHWKNEKNLE